MRKAAEARAKAEKAVQLATTRQRELVKLGYRVAIDGDWGPKSAEAWADYQARKRESYVESWGAEMIAAISALTNASETLERILTSLVFSETYSEAEFGSAVNTLSNCASSFEESRPPLRDGYESVVQLAAQGCDAYQSALDQLPLAFKSSDYLPFEGVKGALRHGDTRLASIGYKLSGLAGTLGLSGGVPTPAPDYPDPAPDTSYGGDLDCVDFNGPVDVSGGDPHGLDGDGDGIGCE